MIKKKILFIINPISGGKGKKDVVSYISKYLDKEKFELDIAFTKYAGHASEITIEKCESQDIIVAVGGDGTINEIAKELQGTSTVLGIIPLGSGNGLARYLKIPLRTKLAVQALNTAKILEADTAAVNEHFFLSIAGIGFDSLIAAEFEKAPMRGFETYAKLSMMEYATYHEKEYTLKLDGKEIKRTAAMISFANSDQFGYNTRIAPNADISDGLIDVCIFKKPKIYQIPFLLQQLWTAKAEESSLLEIIKAKDIEISASEIGYANVDGESLEVENRVKVIVKPKNLRICIPNDK